MFDTLVQIQLPTPAKESCDSVPLESASNDDRPAFRIATLGCKVNQYESQFVRELLIENGYREAGRTDSVELAVVNTCTVTAEGDSKSRQLVRQIARANPGVKIVVMGCYATNDPDAVRRLPGVAAVITDKRDLAGSLQPFGVRKRLRGIRGFEGRHRAFVKVQDGCILDCTFCIIPKVRPGILSRRIDDIADEVRQLANNGFREIVLTGIHLGHYGIDLSLGKPRKDWQRLWSLLDRLANIPGEFRIRLSSLEATDVTADVIRVMADYQERICPHLHLCLQSGSDRVLQRMQRRYRSAKFLARIDEFHIRLDEPAFTTDVIIGFPGETEAEFAETVATVRAAGFCKLHLFPYSPRKGTEAADHADQIPRAVIDERRAILLDVERELRLAYHHRLIGRQLQMLVESPDPERPGWMRGSACRYVPLRLRTIPELAYQLVPVRAVSANSESIDVESL